MPSAVIPEEKNRLVNPGRPDARRIRIEKKTTFRLDPRVRRQYR